MKDKIFNALKTEFKNLGFSEKALQGHAASLAATGLITDENLDAIVKGQKDSLTAFQSEIDSRVTAAVEKAKKEKTPGGDDEPDKKKKDQDPDPKETPEQKKLRELEEKLKSIETGKKHETLTAKAVESMKAKKLPKSVIDMAMKNRTFEKEEDIEPFVTEVEASHKEYVQELSNQGLGAAYQSPASSATPAQKVESDIESWAKSTTPAAK